jgi:hypothetical protein
MSRPAVATLLELLRNRRSRRFGLGMKMDSGALAYQSRHAGVPLTEEEEALLAFAAAGITGYSLADLCYERGQGGTILAGFVGRTVPSGDAIQTVALVVMNSQATYYLKRPQDCTPAEVADLIALAEKGEYVELYRRQRVKIRDGRVDASKEPLANIDCNRWSLYDPAGTYFLPVNELTFMCINGLLEVLNESAAGFIIDERAGFRPAGLKRFAKSRGGHLDDDPRHGRVITVQQLEDFATEMVTVEQGMVLQNLALMVQALGLGGFPHWAAHAYSWFEALGFTMGQMPASRYLGMGKVLSSLARLFGRDFDVPYVHGLEHAGQPLLKPFCPPHYPTMEAAVRAVVDYKFGAEGTYRRTADRSAWLDGGPASKAAPLGESAVQATIAYCEYVYQRYSRFPCYMPPLRTVLGFQVNHLDTEFYDRYYRPSALADSQRRHMEEWHEGGPQHR